MYIIMSAPLLPPATPLSPPSLPPPVTARSVALGVGYCRDASGNNPWNHTVYCVTALECGQHCEATVQCACYAYSPPGVHGNDAEGCYTAATGRCVLYVGSTIAEQASGAPG